MALVQFIEAFVASAIRILLHAKAVHFLVYPVTGVFFAIGPSVSTEAFNEPVLVFSCVGLTIRPFLDTVSMSFVIFIATKELGLIRISLFADAMHDTFAELSLVDKEVYVSRNTFSVVHVVGPLSFISLALDLCELTVAVSVAKIPCAFIRSTILKAHDTTAMSETAEPLAVIGSARSAITMNAYLKLRTQLSLTAVSEKIDLDYSTFCDGLHCITDQELLAISSAFISDLQILYPLQLASPDSLDLYNPI